MLEATLLMTLVKAKTYWELDWHNDAQDIIREAVSQAADSRWEQDIDRILNPYEKLSGSDPNTYEELQRQFLAEHPQFTQANLFETSHPANQAFHQVCVESDRQYEAQITRSIEAVIGSLSNEIGDKVHRRNLQINDLKRQLEIAKRKPNYPTPQPDVINRLTPADVTAIRSALSQKINDLGYGEYREAMGHLNTMYPRRPSDDDLAVTHQHFTRCSCGHLVDDHEHTGQCHIEDCNCKGFNGKLVKDSGTDVPGDAGYDPNKFA